MSAAALALPPIPLPWYAKPYYLANLPKAAEKVWACLRFMVFSTRSSTITITDHMAAQWCSANLGVHVGRRCFQKGLKQLEDIGAIVRRRYRGGREITITIVLAGPKPKTRPKAPARKARTATAAAPATSAPTPPPEPPPSPEECRQAAAALRALIDKVHAEDHDPAGQAEPTATDPASPLPRATTTRRPRLHIPENIRREVEERERRRRADELAGLRAIPDDRRTDDQRRRLNGLAAELGEPGSPPAPSGP